MGGSADTYLEHYGIKGMRWGRRKKQDDSSAPSADAHEDAVKAARGNERIKSSGTSALSNKELQEVITRMNLERQYAGLTEGGNKKRGKAVEKFIDKAGDSFSNNYAARNPKPASIPSKDVELYTPPSAKKMVGDVLLDTGKQIVTDYAVQLVAEGVKSVVKARFGF